MSEFCFGTHLLGKEFLNLTNGNRKVLSQRSPIGGTQQCFFDYACDNLSHLFTTLKVYHLTSPSNVELLTWCTERSRQCENCPSETRVSSAEADLSQNMLPLNNSEIGKK